MQQEEQFELFESVEHKDNEQSTRPVNGAVIKLFTSRLTDHEWAVVRISGSLSSHGIDS